MSIRANSGLVTAQELNPTTISIRLGFPQLRGTVVEPQLPRHLFRRVVEADEREPTKFRFA
jgi:hypothetical protein